MAVLTYYHLMFNTMCCRSLLQGSIPFAVIGSNNITDVRGKQVRVRQYPWGMAEGICCFGVICTAVKSKVFTVNLLSVG